MLPKEENRRASFVQTSMKNTGGDKESSRTVQKTDESLIKFRAKFYAGRARLVKFFFLMSFFSQPPFSVLFSTVMSRSMIPFFKASIAAWVRS